MVIDEQKILYTVDSGNFFGHKRKTTNWAEAKKLIKDLIAKSKKKTAYLTVSYKDIPLGSFGITDASTIEKPRLEIGLEYKDLLKKAITIKACAYANNEISVFFIDKNTTALSNIKTIRNKFEHSPHLMRQIIVESSGSSKSELFGFTYEIKGKTYELHYSDLLRLITQLNKLFDNIRDELITANEQEDITANYKLLSMYELSLQRFNRIYSSNILKDVGRIMWPI